MPQHALYAPSAAAVAPGHTGIAPPLYQQEVRATGAAGRGDGAAPASVFSDVFDAATWVSDAFAAAPGAPVSFSVFNLLASGAVIVAGI